MSPQLQRALVWQRLDRPGSEYFTLWRDAHGWQLRGTVVVALDGRPLRVRYGVLCDVAWRTRAVHIGLREAGPEQALHLIVQGEQWRSGLNDAQSVLEGCVDVDLGITPATNTLPIRRLKLDVGDSREIRAAWVRFPALTVQPVTQHYTRLDTHLYRYQSGVFSAELEVDNSGLVIRYPGLWERAALIDSDSAGEV